MNFPSVRQAALLGLAAALLPNAHALILIPNVPQNQSSVNVTYDNAGVVGAGSYYLDPLTTPSPNGAYFTTAGAAGPTSMVPTVVTTAAQVAAGTDGTLITPGGISAGVTTEAWSNDSGASPLYTDVNVDLYFTLNSPTPMAVPLIFSGDLQTDQGNGSATATASITGYTLQTVAGQPYYGEYNDTLPTTTYISGDQGTGTLAPSNVPFSQSFILQSGPTIADPLFTFDIVPEDYYHVNLTDYVSDASGGPGFAYALDDPMVEIDPTFAALHPEVTLVDLAPPTVGAASAPDAPNTLILAALAAIALAALREIARGSASPRRPGRSRA